MSFTLSSLLDIRQQAHVALGTIATQTSDIERYRTAVSTYRSILRIMYPAMALPEEPLPDPTDYAESTPAGFYEWLEEVLAAADAKIAELQTGLDLTELEPDPLPPGIVLIDEGSGSGL